MRCRSLIFPLFLVAAIGVARADEQLPVLQAGSEVYSNLTVTSVSATDIYFIYAGGMANVKLKNLSPALQKHFGYDPKQAQAVELKQAASNAKFHDQLLHQPVGYSPDLTREQTAPPARTSGAVWREDFPGALKQAQSEHKRVLLDFTGSDWCPWCIKFDHEVFSTEKFAAYAAQKLELVKVDFLRHTLQSAGQKQANEALATQFGVDSYPTYVLLNSDGRELGRQDGYQGGGPDAFIKELEDLSSR